MIKKINESTILSPANTVVDIIMYILKSDEFKNYPHSTSTENMFKGHRSTSILSTAFVDNNDKSLFFEIDESIIKNAKKRDQGIIDILVESADTLKNITDYFCDIEQIGSEQFELRLSQQTKNGSTHKINFQFLYGVGGPTKVKFYGWESKMIIPNSHFTIANGILDL